LENYINIGLIITLKKIYEFEIERNKRFN